MKVHEVTVLLKDLAGQSAFEVVTVSRMTGGISCPTCGSSDDVLVTRLNDPNGITPSSRYVAWCQCDHCWISKR